MSLKTSLFQPAAVQVVLHHAHSVHGGAALLLHVCMHGAVGVGVGGGVVHPALLASAAICVRQLELFRTQHSGGSTLGCGGLKHMWLPHWLAVTCLVFFSAITT